MSKRNSDGTFRNNNKATRISQRSMLAGWVEREALALKLLGFPFSRIAIQITDVGRGLQRPLIRFPEGLEFPPDYSISGVACFKAFNRVLEREPQLLSHRYRQVINLRSEQLYLAGQAAIQRGDPKAILVALRTLELLASINGLKSNRVTNLPIPATEPHVEEELPAQAILSLFDAAINTLYNCGAVPRPIAPDSKRLEGPPVESPSEDDVKKG
jgi:hypothetical protein